MNAPFAMALIVYFVKHTARPQSYSAYLRGSVAFSADLQVIAPWNPSKSRATYAALRLQTKF
jgi:hypothetical protein